MIRFSCKEDLPLVKNLWMQAFHDSAEATDFYFCHRWREDNLLIDILEGELRGMLSLLPIELVTGGQRYPARYFFAIATDERFKRRGISTDLIAQAERLTQQEGGAAAVLVPAGEKLFRFYGKRGFDTVFYLAVCSVAADSLPPCPAAARVFDPSAGDMLRLRDERFATSCLYARWDREALDFIVLAAAAWEAPILGFTAGFGEGYAYCERHGDAFVIKELVLKEMEVLTALAIVHSRLQAKRYEVRLAGDTIKFAGGCRENLPYGMIRWLDEKPVRGSGPAYLGFGKD